jgi:hypothetical protein
LWEGYSFRGADQERFWEGREFSRAAWARKGHGLHSLLKNSILGGAQRFQRCDKAFLF